MPNWNACHGGLCCRCELPIGKCNPSFARQSERYDSIFSGCLRAEQISRGSFLGVQPEIKQSTASSCQYSILTHLQCIHLLSERIMVPFGARDTPSATFTVIRSASWLWVCHADPDTSHKTAIRLARMMLVRSHHTKLFSCPRECNGASWFTETSKILRWNVWIAAFWRASAH